MKIVQPVIIIVLMLHLISCGNNDNAPASKSAKETSDSMSVNTKTRTIIFFGNSITAGYGVTPSEAFPALIQEKIDSLKLSYKVINAGVSGETSSGGNARINWILRQSPDVFILELGGNDGLRGIPLAETRKNLQLIVDKVKAKNAGVKILIAGMQIPPSMGQKYAGDFRDIFPELARNNNAILIPFLLAGVGGEEKLNQQDGIHPTAEGHKIVAANVWQELKKLL